MTQPCRHRHLHIVGTQRWHHNGHIAIHTPNDIIHVDSSIDAHQQCLQSLVALHQRQETGSFHIHEDTCQGIIGHTLHIVTLDRTINCLRLLQGLINAFVEREGLARYLQNTILYLHACGYYYL